MVLTMKVLLIVYGAVMVLLGSLDIIMPDLVAELYGFGEMARYAIWMVSIIGAYAIAIGVWVVIAGLDPLRHMNWVKFIITKCVLTAGVTIFSVTQGYVEFNQVGAIIIVEGVFAMVIFALYPWRVSRSSQQEP